VATENAGEQKNLGRRLLCPRYWPADKKSIPIGKEVLTVTQIEKLASIIAIL
jgi:hypothetical protein